ncbi:MAG: hypothetical protein OHK0021_13960 [Bryobacter sp.]
MLDFDLPLVTDSASPEFVYRAIRRANRSAAILETQGAYYLVMAKHAFIAWRFPERHTPMARKPLNPDELQVITKHGGTAIVRVLQEGKAQPYFIAPPACYCPNGHPGFAEGACMLCKEPLISATDSSA